MNKRQEYNLKILKILQDKILNEPNIRFIQHLWNLQIIDRDDRMVIIDRFYEEPEDTFKRIST